MKYMSTIAATVLMGVSFATSAFAEESIADREAWLAKAVTQIEAGEINKLETTVKTTLGESMHDDVETLLGPLQNVMADHKPIYVDKIVHEKMGQTFDQHIYAAYYGERDFLFYAFTFARLENGWQLYSLDFADELSGLNPIN